MTKIELALQKFAELPPEDQDEIAEFILAFDLSEDDYVLTPEQLAEIERRAADPDPKYLTSEEVWAHFKLRGV